MKFCVIGAGSGGRAFAAYLKSKGLAVNLYNRSFSRIKYIKKKGGIKAIGDLKGFFPLDNITRNLKTAVKDADIIMIVIPAFGHKDIAKKLAPYLTQDQIIILNPGRTFGAMEFRKTVKNKRENLDLIIAETQTLLFTSRSLKKNGVNILKVKNIVKFSAIHERKNFSIYNKLKKILPQFKPVNNYLELTLNNIGMFLHPTLTLLNSGAIEMGLNFKFYKEGATNRICKILERLQFEINQIFMKLGLKRFNFCRWANQVYDAPKESIHDTLQKIKSYQNIDSPNKLKTRYFTEDVPTGLVPLSSLGTILNINTPTIDSIIHLSSILCGIDFWQRGRTIESLNLIPFLERRINLDPSIIESIEEPEEYFLI